jgi:hypothetical protein
MWVDGGVLNIVEHLVYQATVMEWHVDPASKANQIEEKAWLL